MGDEDVRLGDEGERDQLVSDDEGERDRLVSDDEDESVSERASSHPRASVYGQGTESMKGRIKGRTTSFTWVAATDYAATMQLAKKEGFLLRESRKNPTGYMNVVHDKHGYFVVVNGVGIVFPGLRFRTAHDAALAYARWAVSQGGKVAAKSTLLIIDAKVLKRIRDQTKTSGFRNVHFCPGRKNPYVGEWKDEYIGSYPTAEQAAAAVIGKIDERMIANNQPTYHKCIWACCDDCGKWRRLLCSGELPEQWYCRMNPCKERSTCDAPEEEMLGNEEEM